ncbi:MAG: HEPN domain-containing protein [Candidatus Binatia bacterium]
MTPEQADLLVQAHDSVAAAKVLHTEGHHGFAASRAYYAMFYVAEAFLLGKGLAFSKHSGVHAAFGEHFAKTGVVPIEFHRYLVRGMQVRHAGDYGKARKVTSEEAAEQITHAEQFLELAERLIGPLPPANTGNA